MTICKWPTIALGAGYSEDEVDLVRDSEILLKGSSGKIGVVLVKIAPLSSAKQSPSRATLKHGDTRSVKGAKEKN